ncbi:ATP-binding protein [Belliella kenyensis]|uniref:ATP-binding protein n=1 Tax=Belliella kenyensis TaxID=1472724 RepID=A0ABV8EN71_9BACT|nr:ATP-binding protein [Belliella kenyensis]MCH7401516.1 ATP-binding protein [Belliella kenyensis]MDN3603203.1 ATP-binding protein [Belliella kenyensis]
MVNRVLLNKILQNCFKGKVILLLGARQVGKTTLLEELLKEINQPSVWLNADEADILEAFTEAKTSTQLIQLIGSNNKLVIIDEAQQIPDIGKKLKLIYDSKAEIQIIATGSSAFDLQNNTAEPLTGRKKTFHLFPLSYQELADSTSRLEAKRLLDTRLIYGSYPDVVNNPGREKEILIEIAQSYLYKDILQIDNIRKPSHIDKLLKALAFQIGSEVSYHELAQTVGNIDTATVEKYLDLLEKAYVIFKLPAFSRNLRNEIKKGKKYYFYDNGIRNVLINNFSIPEMRMDKGALWENFLVSERMKSNHYNNRFVNTYFWRTHDKAEIDYIEEEGGILDAFEFKWKDQKVRFPASFLQAYPEHRTSLINRSNFEEFLF